MSWRVIDVAEDGRHLHAYGQWVVVSHHSKEVGRVPLVDLQSILVHAEYATYTHDLLRKLAESNIPLVVCDRTHTPTSVLLPLAGHHAQAGRVRAQAAASLPIRKRLWRDLVRAKILEQARTLASIDDQGENVLQGLAKRVRSGDRENHEGQAAKIYWPRLFGRDFRRDRMQEGVNAHLNYGYTVLRSALARATVESGLIPSLGIGHVNARNNLCLVDDLMEPFRPLVDRLVWENRRAWNGELQHEHRAALVGLMGGYVETEGGATNLYRVMSSLASSLVYAYESGAGRLNLPKRIEIIKPGT